MRIALVLSALAGMAAASDSKDQADGLGSMAVHAEVDGSSYGGTLTETLATEETHKRELTDAEKQKRVPLFPLYLQLSTQLADLFRNNYADLMEIPESHKIEQVLISMTDDEILSDLMKKTLGIAKSDLTEEISDLTAWLGAAESRFPWIDTKSIKGLLGEMSAIAATLK